jgi:predicted transcriptional regulator
MNIGYKFTKIRGYYISDTNLNLLLSLSEYDIKVFFTLTTLPNNPEATFSYSIRKLAKKCHLSPTTIQISLKKLITAKFLERRTAYAKKGDKFVGISHYKLTGIKISN